MEGIYIHVPFCRQACRYCDFYFTVSLKHLDDYFSALLKEIEQKQELSGAEEVKTIYFGGGTPSVLSIDQLRVVLAKIYKTFAVSADAEITLEANPDDLNKNYLGDLKNVGINRLSIGVQSFHQDDLSLMRRSHNETQSTACIKDASSAGFENINMDLIYGVPGLNMQKWKHNLQAVMSLPVQHLSAYHLTYEEGTIFHHWRKKGKLLELEEKTSVEQYHMLRELSREHGFEHYEISNFSKAGFRSKHNTSYWENKKYLGLGPAAHSYNGKERSWNVSSLKKYIENVNRGGVYSKKEELSEKDKFNDYLIISLRTINGISEAYIKENFGEERLSKFLSAAKTHTRDGNLIRGSGYIKIDPDLWLKADMIIRDLIV